MCLDTAYFDENWKFITENTIAKYFLLLHITIHPFLALGWSMNSAMDKPKNTTYTNANANAISSTQTHPNSLIKKIIEPTVTKREYTSELILVIKAKA